MRNIMMLLTEVQKERVKQSYAKRGLQVEPAKLQEIDDAFAYIDRNLVGAMGNGGEGKLAEAMTTGDFQNALGEFVQRRLIPGYTQKMFDFEPLVRPDTLPNYMKVTRYQNRAGLDDLEFVPPKGVARTGSYMDATKREYQVFDFSKVFDFDFHALVNDDLGYFNDLASDMGRAARRTLEKFVSRMYTNATTIAALVALGALYSTTGRLTSDRISTARMAFNQRVDDRGEPVLATLTYLVYPSGLSDQVWQIQNSQLVPESNVNGINVVANGNTGGFVGIQDPFIVATAPNLPWYAFTRWNENNITPFVLARRQGIAAPMLLRKRSDTESFSSLSGGGGAVSPIMGDFLTGNVQFKVHDVWGTYIDAEDGNLFDVRGAYYSSGTVA